MRTEVRFLLAIGLMVLVIFGTNYLFPPADPPAGADPVPQQVEEGPRDAEAGATGPGSRPSEVVGEAPDTLEIGAVIPETEEPAEPATELPPERRVTVEGPLYRLEFSTRGARLLAAVLPRFPDLHREGQVQLIPEGSGGILGHRLVVGNDTLDLRGLPFEVEPADGFVLEQGDAARNLTFRYEHPTSDFAVEITYGFDPGSYLGTVEGSIRGVDQGLVLTDMGSGINFTEADSAQEAGMMAWVGNHLTEGIDAHSLQDVEEQRILHDGPFLWAAFKSKFFVLAVLPATAPGAEDYLGGILTRRVDGRPMLTVAQNLGTDGAFDFNTFVGPQEYGRLSAMGEDLEEVNPYGWRFFRPVIRPFVGVIMTILTFLHNTLNIGYGWVLIVFGVVMRVLLWPLNQKAMRAQMRNMAVQPMLKEIQAKYKDNPERLQKEMMKLYKEYGFNPLAGCLPMLLPWPILISLFFVFQNTIELRGEEFLWLADLSAKDPYYILPIFLAISMFLLQWISFRSMDQNNPQMKMMMWIMPLFMGFIFMQFASGLNLYYATVNVATLPQQFIIARERKKAQERGPVKRGEQ